MGKLSNGVQKRKRDGKFRLVIDFRYRDKDGREQRYRKDARIQTRAGADAEARRLMEIAHTTGTLELRPDAPTLRAFVDDTFKPLFRTKFRPGTGSGTRGSSARVFSTSLVTSTSTRSRLRRFERSWRFSESAASSRAAP